MKLNKKLQIEIMKFFMKTSIPKIVNERKSITSN